MTSETTPWPGYEDLVRELGQSWIETRFATWLLLDLMPELEADPSRENWERVIPIQQFLLRAGTRFEEATRHLLGSRGEWIDTIEEVVHEARRTLIAESEWCGTRMQILTERERQPAWPFPFHHAIRS